MKAVCIRFSFELRVIGIDVGTKVDYERLNDGPEIKITTENGKSAFVNRESFFYIFKVIEGDDKMTYSDFEYILCNRVFTMAVLFPNEYCGIRHLIIQNYDYSIMININKEEDVIRVSFPNIQMVFKSYEEALDRIILWKGIDSKF